MSLTSAFIGRLKIPDNVRQAMSGSQASQNMIFSASESLRDTIQAAQDGAKITIQSLLPKFSNAGTTRFGAEHDVVTKTHVGG